MSVDFQSLAPGDPSLRNDLLSGYQPVSRIGEIVNNAFVDNGQYVRLAEGITADAMYGKTPAAPPVLDIVEHRPHFHEWATALPGMVAVSEKKRSAHFRGFNAAEHAIPVIVTAACIPKNNEEQYFFAGIVRSKSVRVPDDGIGNSVDEFFTVSLGGMATVLNTGDSHIQPGDLIEWTFATNSGTSPAKRLRSGPRRIAVKVASQASPRIIGKAISFAKKGEDFDLLLKQ